MSDLSQIEAFYRRLVPNLTQEAWLALTEKLEWRTYQKNEYLIQPGEVCRYVFYINQGFVRFYYLADGKEIIVGFIDAGNYVSEYAGFLQQIPSRKYLQALDTTETILLSYNNLQWLYQQYPAFQVFGRKVAESLFITFDRQLDNLTTRGPEERYKVLVENRSTLLQSIPQYMLASYLGITPEHLSRLRRKIFRQ